MSAELGSKYLDSEPTLFILLTDTHFPGALTIWRFGERMSRGFLSPESEVLWGGRRGGGGVHRG